MQSFSAILLTKKSLVVVILEIQCILFLWWYNDIRFSSIGGRSLPQKVTSLNGTTLTLPIVKLCRFRRDIVLCRMSYKCIKFT